MEPLLSVCLITYNHKDYIRQAIEGVLMQQVNFPIDIIIADDFSTDGTREIIIEYQQKYPDLIKLILQQKNVGAAQNWIDLISAPKGKYIAYFEGDDYWTDPNKLQKQVDFLEENEDYAICFHRANLYRNGELSLHPIPLVKNFFYTYADLLNTYNFITTASVVFRNNFKMSDMVQKLPFGDLGLYYFATRIKDKIACLNEVMSVYRIHEQGAWSKKTNIEGLNDYYNFYSTIYSHLTSLEKNIVKNKIAEVSNKISLHRYPGLSIARRLYAFYLRLRIIG